MPKPFIAEHLFEVNDNKTITVNEDHVIIDDYYKNYEDIVDFFDNLYVESWKMTDDSRNFIDYYDCRYKISNWFPREQQMQNRLADIHQQIHNLTGKTEIYVQKALEFNVFKHKRNTVSSNMQHHPHYDGGMFNYLTYIDPYCSGGTAIYENQEVPNKESQTLLVDISNYKLKHVIPSKPNRTIIFDGELLHGAYIEDNSVYYDNWRITQANLVVCK